MSDNDPKNPKGPRTPLGDILRPPRSSPEKLVTPNHHATKATTPEGQWRDDVLEDARRAIVEVMRDKNPVRNVDARLRAAMLILNDNFLSQISDEALLEEVRRRAGMNAAEAETSNEVEEKEEE